MCHPENERKKERKHTTQGRDGRTARRHHTGILRRGGCDALAVAHPGSLLKERKQTRQTRDGTRTGSPPARAGFWKNDQGDRWGSPAPDKGHDRLAARCAVDSHIHWRSHLSLATCLQLVAGSLSYRSPGKERKKENRHAKRGMGRGQGPHLHEQDFGRTIRGTGGALLLLVGSSQPVAPLLSFRSGSQKRMPSTASIL